MEAAEAQQDSPTGAVEHRSDAESTASEVGAGGVMEENVTAQETPRTQQSIAEAAALEVAANSPTPGEGLQGIAPDSSKFVVPTTPPAVNFSFKDSSILDWLQRATLLLTICLGLANLPGWFYVLWFLFWRAMYNVFLGALLKWQSEEQYFTKLYVKWIGIGSDLSKEQAGPLAAIARPLMIKTLPTAPGYSPDEMPSCFNAWICWRALVDVVLNNDVFSYVIFCYQFFSAPEAFTLRIFGCYLLAALLGAFTIWAKVDAYRVIKDFAWYWGDFFFLIDQNLTFDRIFAMFPHPMYTIGYAFFYGATLLTQSHTVLYVSILAHAMQLAFLSRVENPHIEKTYPCVAQEEDVLNDAESAYFRKDLIVFKNFNYFRSSDLFTVVTMFYILIQALSDQPGWVFFLQALAWRAAYNGGLGYVLFRQSQNNNFVRHFLERGATKVMAFENWKRIRNFVMIMMWTSFCVCGYALADWEESFSGFAGFRWFCFRQVLGSVLVAINIWSAMSEFEVLGEFGWFYGDFFLDEARPRLYYTGIYRFLNNPEHVTGSAALYGVALMSGTWVMFSLAVISQLCNLLFHMMVEEPHMKRLYGNKIRAKAGIEEGFEAIVEDATKTPQGAKVAKRLAQLKATSDQATEKMLERAELLVNSLKEVLASDKAKAE